MEAAAAPRPGEVHVWWASTDAGPGALERLYPLLSATERERVERLARGRLTVALSLALRRSVLGAGLELDPARIEFEPGPRGKPALPAAADLRFNVSHSGDAALVAVARGREVGVDVEWLGRTLDWHRVAGGVLTASERAALDSLPDGAARDGFFRLWTAKEAWLKANGEGLAGRPDRIQVSLAGEQAELGAIGGDRAEAARWRLRELSPPARGYRAALVVEGRDDFALVERSWSPPGVNDAA